jgi:hypothetical protein
LAAEPDAPPTPYRDRRKLIAIAGGVMVLAVILVAAAAATRSKRPPPPAAPTPSPSVADTAAAIPSSAPAVTSTAGSSSDEAVRAEAARIFQTIAEEAASCRQPGDPAGIANIRVTFEPTGEASSIELEKGTFHKTKVGDCVLKLLKGAHVTPFSGKPVTLTRAVIIR